MFPNRPHFLQEPLIHRRRASRSGKGPWGPYLNQFPAGATNVLGAIRGDRITPVKDGSQRGVSCTARSTANEARLSQYRAHPFSVFVSMRFLPDNRDMA